MQIPLLDSDYPLFPSPLDALSEPDGLLAAGGNLLPETLVRAYRSGIFPWYQDGDPILWWSPATRCVIEPSALHCSRSLRKSLRRKDYLVTLDRAFDQVIYACSEPRDDDGGTWITEQMMAAYNVLHQRGDAHSIEVWHDHELIGGLYGVAVGGLFCGESMYSRRRDSSKIAMAHLCRWAQDTGIQLIDCQLVNPHLSSLGAIGIERCEFLTRLSMYRDQVIDWPLPTADSPTPALDFDWG